MQKSYLAIAVASLLSYTSFSYAQDVAEGDTIVVTANRFEQSLDSTTIPVEVVTKEEIAAIQANSVTEVLRRLPGVQISANGGYGQTQSVYVRGAESDHTLFLLDGVRVGSATLGSAPLAAIPVFAIERIEYIRGSRAVMYGSDAIGGVVNIITKNRRSEAKVGATVGSDSYKQGQISIAKNVGDDLHISLAANRMDSDGFSATDTAGSEDDDGTESKDVVVTLDYDLNDELSVDFQALYHEGEVEFDSGSAYKYKDLYNLAGSIHFANDSLTSQVQVSKNRDLEDYVTYSSVYETERSAVAFTNKFQLNDNWLLGAGIDWYQDDVSGSTADFAETSRDNTALYVNSAYQSDDYQFEGAVRNDDNERYGQNTTWQLGAGWNFLPTYRLTANAGTGFKAPTFNDLYSSFGGSSTLKPEESESYELAVEGSHALFDWRIGAYLNKIENMIVWDYSSSPYSVDNVGEVEIKGVELSTNFDTGLFTHSVSVEYMDPKDKEDDSQLVRRAKKNAKWNVSYFADTWQADLSYLYQGKRYDSNNVKLESYSLVELAVSYLASDALTLKGRVANVFDEDYTLANGYNTQERSYFASVEYGF